MELPRLRCGENTFADEDAGYEYGDSDRDSTSGGEGASERKDLERAGGCNHGMREPRPGELGALKYDWARVVEGGFVCASVLDGAAWIHELRYSGADASMPLKMMRAAVKQCKAWGYDS